jgi:two-component system sensor histidine kinase CpxA
MRSLYTRILLSCFGTLLFSLVTFLVISITVGAEEYRNRFHRVFQLELREATRIYNEQGPDAATAYLAQLNDWFSSKHFLVDSQGRDVVTGEDRVRPAGNARQASAAGQIGYRVLGRVLGSSGTIVTPADDGAYSLVTVARPWDNIPGQMPYYLGVLIVTAILYSFVAVGIASALKTISKTADRLGQGDLDARLQFSDRKDELGRVARSFNAMAVRLQTLLVAERRLLQDVSHELRSPLARLEFAAELVRTAPDRDKAVDRLKRELRRLSNLVASLLDVTRAEGDPSAHGLEPVRVDEVVREVVESCTLEAEARGCRIMLTGASSARIRGDRELLWRAFDNVVRNGLQYSPAGSEIEVHLQDAVGETTIEVRDYGPGVPDELLSRIFEPFFRVDGARRASTGGVGLGLSIVSRVVQLHQGSLIAANSNPGLRVTITMPQAA